MKIALAWIAFGLGGLAFGGEYKPPSLGNVRGTILTGMVDRGRFTYTPGVLSECVLDRLKDVVVFSCDAQGQELTVSTDAGKVIGTFTLDKSHVYEIPKQGGITMRRYYLVGTYRETGTRHPFQTPATVTLKNTQAAPKAITGALELKDMGVTSSLVAD